MMCKLINKLMQAFAAGADIKEMQNRDFASNYRENFLGKTNTLLVSLFLSFPSKAKTEE
jgi:hypothetical protein